MITNAATNKRVESGGLAAVGSFSIKANSKAFKILSDGLYSDKPRAIVRELSCNAFDAHVAAGKPDLAFEVHLPNAIEPWFSVIDYGTGLSDAQVMKLYTTYFESTKTGSNDFIGALGLGSKSPFSYVDSFTVTSRHKGMKRIYTAFLGEHGCPMIAKLHEEKTTKPNGLEVSMPVKANDFLIFCTRAIEVLSYFDPLPTILGSSIELKKREFVIDEQTWALRKQNYQVSAARAIQGNVAYPLDSSVLSEHLPKEQHAFLDLDIDLRFKIGDLEVAASREALQYDQRTIANLKKRFVQVAKAFPAFFTKELEKAQTLWEAKIAYAKIIQDISSHSLKRALGSVLSWRGHNNLADNIYATAEGHAQVYGWIDRYDLYNARGINWRSHVSVTPSPNIRVFWIDSKHRDLRRRLQHNLGDVGFTTVLLVDTTAEAVTSALDKLGNPPYQKISELESPPPIPRAPRQIKLRGWNGNYWDEISHSPKDGGVFVRTVNLDVYWNDRYITWFKSLAADAYTLGLFRDTIIGIPASHKNIPTKYPGWTSFFELVEKKITELVANTPNLEQRLANTDAISRIGASQYIDLFNHITKLGLVLKRKRGPMAAFATAYDKLQAEAMSKGEAEAVIRLMQRFNLKRKVQRKPAVDLVPLLKAVQATYPLLDYYSYSSSNNDTLVREWVDYINLKDTQHRSIT